MFERSRHVVVKCNRFHSVAKEHSARKKSVNETQKDKRVIVVVLKDLSLSLSSPSRSK